MIIQGLCPAVYKTKIEGVVPNIIEGMLTDAVVSPNVPQQLKTMTDTRKADPKKNYSIMIRLEAEEQPDGKIVYVPQVWNRTGMQPSYTPLHDLSMPDTNASSEGFVISEEDWATGISAAEMGAPGAALVRKMLNKHFLVITLPVIGQRPTAPAVPVYSLGSASWSGLASAELGLSKGISVTSRGLGGGALYSFSSTSAPSVAARSSVLDGDLVTASYEAGGICAQIIIPHGEGIAAESKNLRRQAVLYALAKAGLVLGHDRSPLSRLADYFKPNDTVDARDVSDLIIIATLGEKSIDPGANNYQEGFTEYDLLQQATLLRQKNDYGKDVYRLSWGGTSAYRGYATPGARFSLTDEIRYMFRTLFDGKELIDWGFVRSKGEASLPVGLWITPYFIESIAMKADLQLRKCDQISPCREDFARNVLERCIAKHAGAGAGAGAAGSLVVPSASPMDAIGALYGAGAAGSLVVPSAPPMDAIGAPYLFGAGGPGLSALEPSAPPIGPFAAELMPNQMSNQVPPTVSGSRKRAMSCESELEL